MTDANTKIRVNDRIYTVPNNIVADVLKKVQPWEGTAENVPVPSYAAPEPMAKAAESENKPESESGRGTADDDSATGPTGDGEGRAPETAPELASDDAPESAGPPESGEVKADLPGPPHE